jgi:hypothetical protein
LHNVRIHKRITLHELENRIGKKQEKYGAVVDSCDHDHE